jgi:hypothetical protein
LAKFDDCSEVSGLSRPMMRSMAACLSKLGAMTLALGALISTVGCAQCSSRGCSTCGNQCPLCCLSRMTHPGCDQVACGEACGEPCGECKVCPLGKCDHLCQRPNPGPPPATLRPCLPPKFLPVPTQPVLSPARPDAPEPARGDVEVSYRNQLVTPGRD